MRFVGSDGSQAGVIPRDEALRLAGEMGLDLVEVAAEADPPVCRAMDYGKFKYQQAKKNQESKRKQTHTQVKEIKMRPKIADHDYSFKMRKILDFLAAKNRVKVTVRFRGREIAYADAGRKLLLRVAEEVGDAGSVDGTPKLEGRQMTMLLAPK